MDDIELTTDQDVTNLVARELEPWMQQLKPFWDDGDDLWAKWHVEAVPDSDPYMSKIQVGYGHYAVEVVAPRILGEKPSIAYQPVDDDRDDLAAVVLGRVATYQLGTMRFAIAARDLIRQGLVTGYSVGKLGWIRKSGVVERPVEHLVPADPGNPEGGSLRVVHGEKHRVMLCNEPFFEVVSNKDFVYPLTARTLKEAPAVWQRRWLTLGYLKDMAKDGFYSLEQVNRIGSSNAGDWLTAYGPQFKPQGLNPTAGDAEPGDDVFGDHSLIEVWERWTDTRLVTIAGRASAILLRDEPNPFEHGRKPFVDFTPTPRPFQMNGVGLMKLIDDCSTYLNMLMRQIADNLAFQANVVLKETPGADPNNSFTFRPGARWRIPEMEDVEPFQMPQIDMAAVMAVRQALLDDMQRLTGAFDYPTASQPGGSHTATGVSTIVQEGTKRIAEMIQVFNERTMVPLGYMLAELNMQYLDEAVLVDFSGDPRAQQAWETLVNDQMPDNGMARVHQDMIETSGRIAPQPQVGQDKQMSDQAKQAAAAQFMSAIAPILASPANPLNMPAVAEYIAKEYGVPAEEAAKMIQTPPTAETAAQAQALSPGSSDSGPSGDNLPTGLAQGAPGAPGPQGPPGMAVGQ